MTLVCLQYSPVFILFIITALLVLTATRLTALLSGIATVVMLLLGLFYAVPLTELLVMLLVLVLLCGYTYMGGGET